MEEAFGAALAMNRFAEGEAQCRAEAERLKNIPAPRSKWLGRPLGPVVSRRTGEPQWWHPLVDSYMRYESEVYRNSREFIEDYLNDTIWFGVDAYGFIAMFFPDGTGPVPCSFPGTKGDALEFLMPLAKHLGKDIEENRFDLNDDNTLGLPTYFSGIGTYCPTAEGKWELDVRSPDYVIDGYERKIREPYGLHISMLPDFLQQEVLQTAKFDLKFSETDYIQPALRMPCNYRPTDDDPEIKVAGEDGKLKILPPHLRMGSAPPPLPRPARPPEYQNLQYPDV